MAINYKKFKRQTIIRALELEKYKYIMDNLYKCNVGNDEKFQKTFNAFYRVRRDEKWRKKFYEYFESIKNFQNITFETIVKDLLIRTGNIEASFSSKLLSTINPNMPIWDQYVLKNLDLEVEGTDKTERMLNTIEVYNEIVRKENEMLKGNEIKTEISKFQEEFKEYKLTDRKALDYLLWNSRGEEADGQ